MANYTNVDDIVQHYKDNVVGYFGPWLLSGLLECVLQGVILTQATNYFNRYPDDSRHNFWTVVVSNALNIVRTIQTTKVVWDKFVLHFGDHAFATVNNFAQGSGPILNIMMAVVVQTFFAIRVFRVLEHNWFAFASIELSMIVALVGTIILTNALFHSEDASAWGTYETALILMLVGTVVCDFLITGSLVFHLSRAKLGHEHTDALVDRIVRTTWTSALPPSIVALLQLILYLSHGKRDFWHVLPHNLMGRLYTVSLLYTLNTRRTVRTASGNVEYVSNSHTQSHSGPVSVGWGSSGRSRAMSVGNEFALQSRPSLPPGVGQGSTKISIRTETHTSDDALKYHHPGLVQATNSEDGSQYQWQQKPTYSLSA